MCNLCVVKSYGRFDSSWGRDRVRSVLEDGRDMAMENNAEFVVAEDTDANIVLVRRSQVHSSYMIACGINAPKTADRMDLFWDNTAYKTYTVNEMTPRLYDCLAYGIVTYGDLGFLSEGRAQLSAALSDARHMVKKFDAPFLLGQTKDRIIKLAPLSEKREFIDPLTCVVGRQGHWSVSDVHSCNLKRQFGTDPVRMLYMSMAYGEKEYGEFETVYGMCAVGLESAVEDATKLASVVNKSVGLFLRGRSIRMGSEGGIAHRSGAELFRFDFKLLAVDSTPFHHKVRTVAQQVHRKFLVRFNQT